MIRTYETNRDREYITDTGHSGGNGLAAAAIATAAPAAVISLGNWVMQMLQKRGGGCTSENLNAICNAVIPAISALRGGAFVGPDTKLTEAEIKIAEQAAKISMLEAEKYTDNKVEAVEKEIMAGQKDQFNYSLGLERRIGELEGAQKCAELRFADYKQAEAEKSVLKDKIVDGEIARVADSVGCLAGQLSQTNQALNATNARISEITKLVVPKSAVCETRNGGNNCCGNGNGQ
jgi:hypothetical protein